MKFLSVRFRTIGLRTPIKTKLGQSRTFSFPDFQEAFYHFCEMTSSRLKRHYHLVQFKAENVIAIQILFWVWVHANRGIKRKAQQQLKEKPPNLNRPLPQTDQLSFVFN